MGMGAEVFVSYSSQDRDRVIPVVEYLRSLGISVWVDEGNIHAADLWSEQIVQAIAGCQVMVVMLSGNSTDSHNVVKEAMLASEQKKALLPVYLESAEIPARLQYQLAGIQHLELYGQGEEQVLSDLVTGLKKRGVLGGGDEVVATRSMSIKRHEKPKSTAVSAQPSGSLAKPIAWALALCVLILLGLLLSKRPPAHTMDSMEVKQTSGVGRIHLKISIPEEYPMAKPTDMPFGVAWRMLAISPNGKHLTYVCMHENERHLCLRSLSDDTFQLLKGSNGAVHPFFSPDENWVGFLSEKKIKKIEISSGLLAEVCDAKNPYAGATWGDEGKIYFGDSEGSQFLKVDENGGEPEFVSKVILNAFSPSVVSNGKGVVLSSPGINVDRAPFSVYFVPSTGDNPLKLLDGRAPSWFGGKHLITVDDNQLRLTEFDIETFKPLGETKTILNSKIRNDRDSAQYSISQNNILAFIEGNSKPELNLSLLDPTKKESVSLSERRQQYGQFSVSPSGEKVAVEIVDNQIYSINIFDIKRGRFSSFLNSKHNYAPFWGVDGEKLYYTSNRTDLSEFGLYVYDFEKQKEEEIILDGETMGRLHVSSVSMDGNMILCFGEQKGTRSGELYYVDFSQRKQYQLTENRLQEWGGVFSPDEKWLAYTSEKDMEGSFAIYLNRFPEMNQEIRISTGGGEEPKWLPDGSGVYYRNGSLWLKVALDLEGEPEIGEPELFFEGDYVNVWGPSHDIFPDGRILLLKGEEWVPPTEIDVIINALDLEP
jgi:Tol biopolymer transport system component